MMCAYRKVVLGGVFRPLMRAVRGCCGTECLDRWCVRDWSCTGRISQQLNHWNSTIINFGNRSKRRFRTALRVNFFKIFLFFPWDFSIPIRPNHLSTRRHCLLRHGHTYRCQEIRFPNTRHGHTYRTNEPRFIDSRHGHTYRTPDQRHQDILHYSPWRTSFH